MAFFHIAGILDRLVCNGMALKKGAAHEKALGQGSGAALQE